MADIPDYTRVAAPVKAGPNAVSAHDLAIADLQSWHEYELAGQAQAVLAARKRYGLEKYGTVLHAEDDRPADQDAEDEITDFVVYLRNWIDKHPELGSVLAPVYQDALWALAVVAKMRAGEQPPDRWLKMARPLVDLNEVRLENLVPDDEGQAMTQDGRDPQIVEIGSPLCGGRQHNGYVCIRVLDGTGWCPRHGKRAL